MSPATTPRTEISVRSAEDQRKLEQAINAGAIVVDTGRRRPFYFDGRFLTAADLIADQEYIRARQSDLAQAMGAGIIRGLRVSLSANPGGGNPRLAIEPGLGITPAGDLVMIANPQKIRLDAIPESQAIDAQLGIKLLSTAAANNRSGLYVLALRAVEFSANPVPAYPTSLDGTRSVHDGDIVEATAVTLIPYPDRAGSESPDAKRARVVREIFFEGQRPGALQEALPLAMLYIEGGALRWLDMYLVRREVGAESTLSAGLRQRPRALLEAWFAQHQDHVDDIDPASVAQGFAATRYFEALPPVGLVPAASLKFDGTLLTQGYFPPVVDCEFAFVPEDELAALVDEALALPPVDLGASQDDLDHLSLLIVAPVARNLLEQHKRDLAGISRAVRPAAPGMIAKRLPLESLLRIARPAIAALDTTETRTAEAWKDALGKAQEAAKSANRGCFWYLRRRQLPYFAEVSGATLRLAGDAGALDSELDVRLRADASLTRFNTLTKAMPRLAVAETVNLLAAPRLTVSPTLKTGRLATSDLLRRSALTALTAKAAELPEAALPHAEVLAVARRFGDPRLGEGFDQLSTHADTLTKAAAVEAIAESGVAPELDEAARKLPPEAQKDFAAKLAELAGAGKVEDIRALVRKAVD